jgi:glutathione S-transferase
MTDVAPQPIKLFQFPRMFAIPNLSPFCCKLETWLRMNGIAYEAVDTPDPRKGPKKKLPFIEESGRRLADTSVIIDHLKASRGIDPDAHLDARQGAIALLVQRTLEEHYAFVTVYTHFVRDEGWQHTGKFDFVPAFIRPLAATMVRGQMKKILWMQGILRHPDEDIIEAGLHDWRAVLSVMSGGPYFFGDNPTTADAIVFGALATTVLTPIPSPIRDFLRARPEVVSYAERMRAQFFPELTEEVPRQVPAVPAGVPRPRS